MAFRQQFESALAFNKVHWFPGHMATGLRQMRKSLAAVDYVVEVHDARIPFSGRNNLLQDLSGHKPSLLVLNKADLTAPSTFKPISRYYEATGVGVMLCEAKTNSAKSAGQVLTKAMKEVIAQPRLIQKASFNIMVVGMPNVGKSTLINTWRALFAGLRKTAKTGANPGVTRSAREKFIICHDPKIYVVDTPGVMMPTVDSVETGMKLALLGMVPDHLVDSEDLADYLLYILNRQQHFGYVDRFKLLEPCDDIDTVLRQVARCLGMLGKGGQEKQIDAANYLIRLFRRGALGKVCLDLDKLDLQAESTLEPSSSQKAQE